MKYPRSTERFASRIAACGIHFGTCVKLAMETAGFPIDFDDLRTVLENKFGVRVILGTHTY